MDEPTSALDGRAADVLERLARQLVDGGTPVVWVTHSLQQLRRLADHVVLITAGRAERAARVEEVVADGG
jgi:ABC-type molybdate transport system ATPase subunit